MMDTHPTELQRIEYLSKLEADAGAVGDDGVDIYRAATNAILPTLFDSLVKSNDFAAADYVIRARGEALGWDAQLLFTRAELYRQRAHPRDLATARGLYEQSIALPGAPAESWRGLGLATLRMGEGEQGRAALNEYLTRRPNAHDSGAIKMILEN
jgi:beta-barrel assembly-enhancing protease